MINSTDLDKAGKYPLTVFARYNGSAEHYYITAKLDFIVALVDPCLYDKLNFGPNFMKTASIKYNVYKPAKIITFYRLEVTNSQNIV